MNMECNVGKTDRILRIVVGLALLAWGGLRAKLARTHWHNTLNHGSSWRMPSLYAI